MEQNLTKEEIMYLYLNQIYFGEGAYGVEVAAQTYFNKHVNDLAVEEMAMLASMPKAPGHFSPLVRPQRAKERQIYVLHRMAEVGFITKDEAEAAIKRPLKVYSKVDYESEPAAFYLEAVRLLLVKQLGEEQVLNKGLYVHTSLDMKKQISAREAVQKGLRELDKRQGYRGATQSLTDPKEISEFLLKTRDMLSNQYSPIRILSPEGTLDDIGPLDLNRRFTTAEGKPTLLPPYIKLNQVVDGIVTKVDDKLGLVHVRFVESQGLIDIDNLFWAHKPNLEGHGETEQIRKPSQVLKPGNVIKIRVVAEPYTSARISKLIGDLKKKNQPIPELPDWGKYLDIRLEQDPLAQGSLLSFDLASQDVLAMIGGYDYKKSEFNRALQAARQTGSSFKAIVYAAALDRGYTPATPIMDAPIVYQDAAKEDAEGQEEDPKIWKPSNHAKTFGGDILFRNALVRSLNVPTVRIIEDIGVPWSTEYARRLGVFSPLNPDFTMALGSSSVTLYEMTKVFSHFARQGKRIHPMMIRKVTDHLGHVLAQNMSLDSRFEQEISNVDKKYEEEREKYFDDKKAQEEKTAQANAAAAVTNPAPGKEEKPKKPLIFFEDTEQLIRPQTAFVLTTLLKGVVEEKGGTGGAARALGREVAGKTGTTNGYSDAWFIGFTPQIIGGVWVGFDEEKTIGKGEVGGRAALPIWLAYMKDAHEGLPEVTFPVPPGIVFATIDNETGKLASAKTKHIIRQAFIEGTEPTTSSTNQKEDDTDFYKQDLSE
jgi:penicillin-binding protein 1A